MLVFLNVLRQERALGPGLFHKISITRGELPQACDALSLRSRNRQYVCVKIIFMKSGKTDTRQSCSIWPRGLFPAVLCIENQCKLYGIGRVSVLGDQTCNSTSWMRFPQVSSKTAIVAPPAFTGGCVNSTPAASSLATSTSISSTLNAETGIPSAISAS